MVTEYRTLTRLEMEQLDRKNTIVILPIGALEQHGNQAPLGTDSMTAEALCRRLGGKLPEEIPVLYLPTIPVGLSTEHINFCGSLTLKPMTLYNVISDMVHSLAHHGFKKILLLNCHGGNAPIVNLISREMRQELKIAVFVSKNSYSTPEIRATVTPGNKFDFHGGEMETSVVLAEHPESVKMETSEPGYPAHSLGAKTITINWISEDYITESAKPIGIGGDPAGATAEKGEIILNSFVDQMVEGLVAIHNFKDQLYD